MSTQYSDFPMWDRMQIYILNNYKTTQKELKQMIVAARSFLPYPILWRGGAALCNALYGDYIWHFAVSIEQETRWNLREFQEGRLFGRNPVKPYRDANPYKERWRSQSWDCGYIVGASERKEHTT